MNPILFFISILLSFAYVQSAPIEYLYKTCKYLDLSYEFNNETIYWPTQESFKREDVFRGVENVGATSFYYAAGKFCAAEHGGTHLDAPSHFSINGQSVEQIPLNTFVSEAFVVNVTTKVSKSRDYLVTVQDVVDYENQHGQLGHRAIVIIYTGWGVYWPNKTSYLGSDIPNDDKHLHFPGVSSELAAWLAANRSIAVLGIDTASMDYGPSKDYPAHRILMAKNISFFENLRNVDKLPPRGATVVAMPISITGGTGAPLRAFAVGWNGTDDSCRYISAGLSIQPLLIVQYLLAFIACVFLSQR